MKKLLILLLAFMLFSTALCEGEAFAFRNGVTWGMTQDAVLAAEGNPEYDTHDDFIGAVTIEIEDIPISGAEGDLSYVFVSDALVFCLYNLDAEEVETAALQGVLTEKYGEPDAEPALDEAGALLARLSGDEFTDEMREWWQTTVQATWHVADGTLIMLYDDDFNIQIGYFDTAALGSLGETSVSEPAPALNPDDF